MPHNKASIKWLAVYLLKFGAFFCLFYFGTLAVMGLSAPGGYYSGFVHNWLDYISWFRLLILQVTRVIVSLIYEPVFVQGNYWLKIKDGSSVRIVYSCLGFGVMSFWAAFIVANDGRFFRKLKWIVSGLIFICLINVSRISLLLISTNQHWAIPFFDHHTWFNLIAYGLIFFLVYFYDRSGKRKLSSQV